MAATNYVGRHHNVDADPFDDNGYDLIHARLVLEHLPQREAVVAKLAAALRPGGWLVVQDYDIRTMAVAEPPPDGWQARAPAMPAMLQSAGPAPPHGRHLLGPLPRPGLVHQPPPPHPRTP